MDEAVDFPEACTFEILVRNPTDKGCFLIDARENDTGYQVMYLENAASVQTYSSFGGEKSFSVPNLDDGNVGSNPKPCVPGMTSPVVYRLRKTF